MVYCANGSWLKGKSEEYKSAGLEMINDLFYVYFAKKDKKKKKKKGYNPKAIHSIQWRYQVDTVSYAVDLALNVQDCWVIWSWHAPF